MKTEPVVTVGLVTTFLYAVLGLVASTAGWSDDLTAGWEAVIETGVTLAFVIGGLVVARSKVSPA